VKGGKGEVHHIHKQVEEKKDRNIKRASKQLNQRSHHN
jgi:hypothetical protein